MKFSAPSFAKINFGLRIGALRPDRFHELRTVYQTIALHDIIHLQLANGSGIEIHCANRNVPNGSSNTCFRIVEKAMQIFDAQKRVVIEIEKRLPVQGGLGAGSSNAATAILLLQRALKRELEPAECLRIAAEIGSDVPLFLIGGTVLGAGRGEEVYPLPDVRATACVIALPQIAVSTPKAFEEWDELHARERDADSPNFSADNGTGLTRENCSDKLIKFSRSVSAWLNAQARESAGRAISGVPGLRRGGRAEIPLLDLVRTGIENDFEKVVFPMYPELREVRRALELAGASYASLSGSGSAVYGLFSSGDKARHAVQKLDRAGIRAITTTTLTRQQYWKRLSS